MKKSYLITAVIISIVFYGCAGKMPQTANEFRQMAPGAFFGKVEHLEVKRSFRRVAKTFKKMAPKCLDKTVRVKSTTPGQYGPVTSVMTTHYNPTVVVGKKKAEIHLQEKVEGTLKVYEEPEKGYYTLVVDAMPAGKNKTKLDIYGPSIGKKGIIAAIKGWASGEVKGCPDLTKE